MNWLKTVEGPVIFTEGQDDCYTIIAICEKFGVIKSFGFYDSGGKDECMKAFSVRLEASNAPEKIAIILDADENLLGKWDSIRTILKPYKVEVPKSPDEKGSIFSFDQGDGKVIKLGVWIMPNNRINGMLEDLCIQFANKDTIKLAEDYVGECKKKGLWNCTDSHLSKSILHAYLAVQDEPGKPIGLSIKNNNLKIQGEDVLNLMNWINNVFN